MEFLRKKELIYSGIALLAGLFMGYYGISQPVFFTVLIGVVIVAFAAIVSFDLALLIFLFYIPFQINFTITSQLSLPSTFVFILAIAGIWFIKKIWKGNFTLYRADFYLPILLFFLAAFASMINAVSLLGALKRVIYYFCSFLISLLVVNNFRTQNQMSKFLIAILVPGTILAIIGLAQFLLQFVFGPYAVGNVFIETFGPLLWGEKLASLIKGACNWLIYIGERFPSMYTGYNVLLRAISILPNPHIFAQYIGFIASISGGLYVSNNLIKKRFNPVLSFIFYASLLAFVFTLNRGGYVGMGVAVLVSLAILFKHKLITRRTLALVLIAGVLIFILFFKGLVPTKIEQMFAIGEIFGGAAEESIYSRIQDMINAYRLFIRHPLTGIGINQYEIYTGGEGAYIHNTYLQILVEMGLFGLLAFLWINIVCLREWYAVFKSSEDLNTKFIALGFINFLVLFMVHNFFDWSLLSPVVFGLFCFSLGLAPVVKRIVIGGKNENRD